MVVVEPMGMDRRLLIEELTDSKGFNVTDGLRHGTGDVKGLLFERELEPMLEGASVDGVSAVEGRVLEYRNLITDIVRYNVMGETESQAKHIYPDPKADAEWLGEKMRERWAARYDTDAGKELLKYRALFDHERRKRLACGSVSERSDVEAKHGLERVIRAANKNMWTQCRNEVLGELKERLRHEEERPLQELRTLQDMHDVQRAALNARTQTPETLAIEAVRQQTAVAATTESHLYLIDTEVEILESLLDTTAKSMRRVHTRVGRLMAKDLRDEAVREEETRKRLQHPEALNFMFAAWNDLDATRSIAQSMARLAEAVSGELEEVAVAAVDAVGAEKDVLLAMGLTGLV